MLKNIKKEIRILGIDDSPFKRKDRKCLVLGVISRGGSYIDGVLSCHITVDGNNSTNKLIELVKKTRHLGQLRCILLKGLSLGGFNVIDINSLSKKTNLPVIVVMRKKPNFDKIYMALKKATKNKKEMKKKQELINRAGKIFSIKIKDKRRYFQIKGISKEKAKEIIKVTSTHALIPEPLRVAHLIAQGIVLGESKGHA